MISSYYLSLISLFNINNFITHKEIIKTTKEFSNYEYRIEYEQFFCKINKAFLIVPNLLNYKLEYLRVINFKFWDKFNLKYTRLDLENNKIKEIPKEIQFLTNLQYLYLDNNKIKTIPEEIRFLTNLKYLSLRSNQITEIPKEIQFLTSLIKVWLNRNKILKIQKEIEDMKNKIII